MTLAPSIEITSLLRAWSGGDKEALDRLVPLVYTDLRRMAHHYANKEHHAFAAGATGLVHEAYLRLAGVAELNCKDRTHFFAVAAQVMRRILTDQAKARLARKRGQNSGAAVPAGEIDWNQVPDLTTARPADLVRLDDALATLSRIDPRRAHVVELRFFGGLGVKETADVLGISEQSIIRDFKLAKAWILRELS